jgi:hypothetical protein
MSIPRKLYEDAFAYFDKDGQGFLDLNMFRTLLTNMGSNKLTDAQFDRVLTRVNPSADGKISVNAFIDWAQGAVASSKQKSAGNSAASAGAGGSSDGDNTVFMFQGSSTYLALAMKTNDKIMSKADYWQATADFILQGMAKGEMGIGDFCNACFCLGKSFV